jgi:hypothetical protein
MVYKREVHSLLSQLEASTIMESSTTREQIPDCVMRIRCWKIAGSRILLFIAIYVCSARYRISFGAIQFSTSRWLIAILRAAD